MRQANEYDSCNCKRYYRSGRRWSSLPRGFRTAATDHSVNVAESFAVVNLDVMSAVRTTEGALAKIGSMKSVVAQLLPQFPLLLFEELEARAGSRSRSDGVRKCATPCADPANALERSNDRP